MRIKLPSLKIIGFILIGIMFVSTFAFSGLQAIFYGSSQQQQTNLPENRIVDHKLTSQQESTILNYGGTIVAIEYTTSCQACLNQKSYLESLVQKYNKIFLEEIVGNSTISKVDVIGLYGQRSLQNATDKEVFSALCEVMYQPPLECVVSQVK